jgi:hypothetical protein
MYNSTVDFGSAVSVCLRWPDFKPLLQSKSLAIQYVTRSDAYTVFAFEGNIVYKCDLIFASHSSDIPPDQDYTQAQNDIDMADFQANFQNSSNKSVTSGVAITGVPTSSDGRLNVLPTLFPSTVQLTIIGAGDDPTLGNGKGTPFTHTSDDGYLTTHTINWGHNDYLYLAGGQIIYANAVIGDFIDYWIYAPATSVTTVSGTGNVNLVGPGSVLIIPGASTNHSVDLTQAVPVPNLANTGFWDWIPPTNGIGKGTIVANVSQTGGYDLYTIQINLTHPITSYQMNGSNSIDLVIPALIPKKVLPQWLHKVIVTNSGHTGLEIVWCLTVARVHNT